jgi:serine/threonine protein kinase
MKPLGPNDPQRVGQYRLISKLGAGGMGSVYLARSDRGRTVAVKLVQPELAAQPEFRQRFQQEVDAARRIGGEWTAPVLDADTQAETPWVATGYVAGPSLHEVVTSTYGVLPERTLRILANGLVHALRDIHAAGLVHRDLKPSNVLITIDGPRVIDFGIARALNAGGDGLTRTGAAVGSPGFMSPEQCRGELVTPASDVFCLGSVLTFAATGRTPFGEANSPMTALMLRIVQGERDLSGVPESMRGFIEACLAQEPSARPTLDQLLQWSEDPSDNGEEPWLPGALVATLGRHAVGLLDSEDPLQVPPQPGTPPPASQPSVTPLPPTMAPGGPAPTALNVPGTPPPNAPGGGIEAMNTMAASSPPPGMYPGAPNAPGAPGAAPGGYGYPQAPGGVNTPYHIGAVGPNGQPVGPGQQNNKQKKIWMGVGAAAAAAALVVGILVATSGGDDDDGSNQASGNEQAQEQNPGGGDVDNGGGNGGDGGNGGNGGDGGNASGQNPQPAPTAEIDPNAAVPSNLVGAWEGEITDANGNPTGSFRRVDIVEGTGGSTVTSGWTVHPNSMCKDAGILANSADGITVNFSVNASEPNADECAQSGSETITQQGNGSLLWTSGDLQAVLQPGTETGRDAMPFDMYGNYTGQLPDGTPVEITLDVIGPIGEKVSTWTAGSCTWEFEMVSGDLHAESVILGPGTGTSPGCDTLGPYRAVIVEADEQIAFQRLDSGETEVTAVN